MSLVDHALGVSKNPLEQKGSLQSSDLKMSKNLALVYEIRRYPFVNLYSYTSHVLAEHWKLEKN